MEDNYGYLGPSGTNSEEALYIYLGRKDVNTVPYNDIEQILIGVSNGQVSRGLVPLENSIEGTVNLTLDLLVKYPELKIAGEVILPIRHNLLVKPGTRKSDVRQIISHGQALAQCRSYLLKFPGVEISEVNSTAEAARLVTEGEGDIAAVGNEGAAGKYGLDIVDRDIQDCKENYTRFIMISKAAGVPAPVSKTSLVVSITDRPGGLYEILKEFALADINLTKIESRPAKRSLGDYLFFIDFIGHSNDPEIQKHLEMIEEMTASFRVLGSYPLWDFQKNNDLTKQMQQKKMTLDDLRQDIDIIDFQIVELLAKRAQIVSLVGSLKPGLDRIRDKNREKEVLKKVKKMAIRKGVSPELMEKIYLGLFDYSVDLQKKQLLKKKTGGATIKHE